MKVEATVSALDNEEVMLFAFEEWDRLSTFNTLDMFEHEFRPANTRELGANFHPLTGGALLRK
jgi:hypothetical protein